MAASENQLIEELSDLGLGRGQAKLVALLPLVHVAWADGQVQDQERTLIMRIAQKRQFADADGLKVLTGWLKTEPSPYYLHNARKLLSDLYDSQGEVGGEIDRAMLEDVLAFCEGVADSAGGVFGLFGRIAAEEKAAITKISGALRLDPSKSWADIKGEFAG